jgi:hypothetical protein
MIESECEWDSWFGSADATVSMSVNRRYHRVESSAGKCYSHQAGTKAF